MTAPDLPTSAFDYTLPPDLIARYPAARRDESRLLVLHRARGQLEHRVFRDLPELMAPGDALVLNETRVFPARLVGSKPTGAAGEVLLLRPWEGPLPCGEPAPGQDPADPRIWQALVRPGSKLKPGRTLEIAEDLAVEVLDSAPEGTRVVRLAGPLSPAEALRRHGRMPLPPYMEREAEPADRERYQTVYARAHGSVAAPTAGLHFTPALLAELERRGVRLVRLVLHVGVGTFRPVEVEDPAGHRMHSEWYELGEPAAEALRRTRSAGAAIWAVGTTVTRTLETLADPRAVVRAGSGWTDLFIRPGHRFRVVDRLITNFHLPRSTLLMLVTAFGGYENVMRAYHTAVAHRYRFYSYGDAMAVL